MSVLSTSKKIQIKTVISKRIQIKTVILINFKNCQIGFIEYGQSTRYRWRVEQCVLWLCNCFTLISRIWSVLCADLINIFYSSLSLRTCVCECVHACVYECVHARCPMEQINTECMISITTSSKLQKYKPPTNQEKLDIIRNIEAIPYVPHTEKSLKNLAHLCQL